MSLQLRSVYVFICACAVYVVIAQNRINETCGIKSTENQYPWLVGIEHQYSDEPKPRIEYTGALISPYHVISDNQQGEATSVRLGLKINITGRSCIAEYNYCVADAAISVPIRKIIKNAESDSWSIMLIILRQKVPYTDVIRPICLPIVDATRSAATDQQLYLTGVSSSTIPNMKLDSFTTLLDRPHCESSYRGRVLPENAICAKDAGDASAWCLIPGSLLMKKRKKTYELIGLFKSESSCLTTRIFINLFLYLDWIRSEIPEWSLRNPLLTDHPCIGANEIWMSYEPGKLPGEENVYTVFIDMKLPASSTIELQFDSETIVTLSNSTAASGSITVQGDTHIIAFFSSVDYIDLTVRGPPRGTVSYFKSLKINTKEYCGSPKVGYLDQYITDYEDAAETELKIPTGCGRRKVGHIALIVQGMSSKSGDWPWHAALYKWDGSSINYICGGTLISNTFVLTAAHCTTVKGKSVDPETFSVVLGKYNLIGGDLESQEKEVHSVIVHDNYVWRESYLENDIALMKLKSEATYNDYVQPACIWYSEAYDRLPSTTIIGTVVGWGIDHFEALSSQLQQVNMPMVSASTCIKRNPIYFSNALGDNKKFCAGWTNGTSTCNGDSGGGYVIYVPDKINDGSSDAVGAWYVRGIVSTSAALRNYGRCDPNQYAVFTDVAKYTGWIQRHLDN